MLNPYSVLRLPNCYEELSLENLESRMKAFWGASKDIYTEETCQKFIAKVHAIPNETKKKEMIFNRLVFVTYYYLKNQKPESADKFKDAYRMIKSEKRRQMCFEKRQETNSVGIEECSRQEGSDSYQKSLEIYRQSLQTLSKGIKSVEKIRARLKIMEKSAPEKIAHTKGVRTMEQLKETMQKNKQRVDPENKFPSYTGLPYRWGFLETRLPDACLMDEKNIEDERVIIIRLGKFLYETNIQSPTEQNPEGKATYQDKADIIGVSKLDENNQLVRNDIVIAKLDEKDPIKDRDYFREVFVSNARIDVANLCNNGFIGGVLKDQEGKCYIEYNNICDSDLVTALELAKCVGAKKCKSWPTEKAYTFTQIKECFKKMQEYYIECILEKETKLEVRGEEEWEK